MSLLPSPFKRKRNMELRQDQLSTDDLRDALNNPAPPSAEPEAEAHHDIFDLVPPSANDRFDASSAATPDPAAAAAVTPQTVPAPLAIETKAIEPKAADTKAPIQTATASMDLTRLSIDDSGHLYWDGKPVEVRRRVSLSGGQILAATIIGLFVIVGGIGAAINGSAAGYEWGCKLGWLRANCASPSLLLPPPPPPRADIPT